MYFLLLFMKFLFLVLPVLISVAFMTLMERKLLSLVGLRVGPNKVSLFGFLQPIGDAAKLANKQVNLLSNFNSFFYFFSSVFLLGGSLMIWTSFFFDPSSFSLKYSLLILFAVLSFNSFNSIVAGWSTFSKYSLIGSIRTVSQLVSYESALYLCLFSLIVILSSFSIGSFFFLPYDLGFLFLLPFLFIWIPSFLAELNRTPYDFSEGESELVSGFNTEFGSVGFTFLFLSEYANIIFFCLLTCVLFMLSLNTMFFFVFVFFVVWIRSVLPRFRFDKLMQLAWKFFIPFLTFLFSCFILNF